MPEDVRALRAPWASLVGVIDFLTPELEREFRFGQSVIRIENQFRLGGNLKGGSSTMWVPTDERSWLAYAGWRRREGFPRRSAPRAYDRLKKFLASHAIALSSGSHGDDEARARRSEKRGPVYEALLAVLRCLPEQHLANPWLKSIQVGGWGPDGAKASAFDQGAVLLYDFAVSGARRTFLGLLLHEFGHACEVSLQSVQLDRLRKHHAAVARPGTLVGVEFLLDPENRRRYQARSFEEFFAETYMMYAVFGRALLRRTDSFPAPAREAWRDIYRCFREIYHDIEYE